MTTTISFSQIESNCSIGGNTILLRPLMPPDVSDAYLKWMNDPDVNRFLECRTESYTRQDLLQYVEKVTADPDSFLFAIIDQQTNRHIGNIKLGPINRIHRRSSIGIIIGETDYFGKGVGTESVALVTRVAFNELRLHKLTAGCYAPNLAAEKVFLKNGFKIEGRRKSHAWYDGAFVDVIEFGRINLKEQTDG